MSLTEAHHTAPLPLLTVVANNDAASGPEYRVIRRNGSVTAFDPSKIAVALTKAFLAVEGNTAAASRRIHETAEALTAQVFSALARRPDAARIFHIEDIQDQVELALMRGEHHKVARAYVLYREERARERVAAATTPVKAAVTPSLRMKRDDGTLVPVDMARLARIVAEACADLDGTAPDPILAETTRNLYEGISPDELALAPILAARTLVESEPNYAFVSARLLLDKLRREALTLVSGRPDQATHAEMTARYPEYFPASLPRASRSSASTRSWSGSISRASAPRSNPSAISSSSFSACRPSTTAISCMRRASASSCRRLSQHHHLPHRLAHVGRGLIHAKDAFFDSRIGIPLFVKRQD
jgi:ribonucleoside-diphosphate reductase alpha chain